MRTIMVLTEKELAQNVKNIITNIRHKGKNEANLNNCKSTNKEILKNVDTKFHIKQIIKSIEGHFYILRSIVEVFGWFVIMFIISCILFGNVNITFY